MKTSAPAHGKPRREMIAPSAMSAYTFKEETVTDTRFGWHFHSEVEINIVKRGRGMRFVGDSIEPFQDGDLVVIGPNLPHACPRPEEDRALETQVIHFPLSFYRDHLRNIPGFHPIGRLLDRSRHGLKVQGPGRVRALEMVAGMAALPEGSSRRAARLITLLALLAEEADCRVLSQGPVRLPDANLADKRVQRVFELIHAYLPEVYPETELAGKLGMTAGAFSHFFRRFMNKSYLDYLGEVRIGLACRELAETRKPIVEVAFAAGFNNLSNFHRQFKKLKGLTPMGFRRIAQSDGGSGAD